MNTSFPLLFQEKLFLRAKYYVLNICAKEDFFIDSLYNVLLKYVIIFFLDLE